jgi:hypothetical protein
MPATLVAAADPGFARSDQLGRSPDSQIWLLAAGGVEQARAHGEGGGGRP